MWWNRREIKRDLGNFHDCQDNLERYPSVVVYRGGEPTQKKSGRLECVARSKWWLPFDAWECWGWNAGKFRRAGDRSEWDWGLVRDHVGRWMSKKMDWKWDRSPLMSLLLSLDDHLPAQEQSNENEKHDRWDYPRGRFFSLGIRRGCAVDWAWGSSARCDSWDRCRLRIVDKLCE